MPTLYNHIGQAVSLGRQLRGASQREVAAACGMRPSRLNRYERGGRCPSLTTLDALLDYLELDPWYVAYLLYRAEGREPGAIMAHALVRLWQVQNLDLTGSENPTPNARNDAGAPHWEEP